MILLALLAACGPAEPPDPSLVTPAETAPTEVAPAEPPPPPAPPPPPPPPPPVVSPDGVVAKPCGAAPEGMGCVPGGPAIRGSDEPHVCDQQKWAVPDKPNYAPAATIWLQTYYMDTTEVTYEAYKACQTAGKCDPAGPSYNDFNRPKQPITGANWYEAVKFCKAHGKHLPTEAEWEKAARGEEGGHFPWGEEPPTCERAIVEDERGRSCGTPKALSHPEKGRPYEVASLPAGRYGLYDMAGNVEEWVADWYEHYDKCGADCLGTDPKGPCKGSAEKCGTLEFKSVKGGSWYWNGSHTTGFHRRMWYPSNSPMHHFGFRCAASVEEAEKLAAEAPATPVAPATPAAPG